MHYKRLVGDSEPRPRRSTIPLLDGFAKSSTEMCSGYRVRHYITSGQSKPLKWPRFYDPELPQGKLLIPQKLEVSPNGQRVAWCAQSWIGNSEDAAIMSMYTCNFDGSDLKRITLTKTMPLSPFKYPQNGVTALNAWQKLQPKPSVPTFTKKGDETDFDKWMREHAEKPTPDQSPTPTPQLTATPKAAPTP